MGRGLEKFRLALLTSLSHDVFGTAKGAAYSAILCLFPTILVLTTLLALTPESDTLRGEMRAAFADVLPEDTMSLLHAYFTNQKVRSEQVLVSAILVSLVAAMGVMNSLMEGFRRAYDLPRREWSFWVERLVSLALVPLCLVPMAFATVMVAFGHQIEEWVDQQQLSRAGTHRAFHLAHRALVDRPVHHHLRAGRDLPVRHPPAAGLEVCLAGSVRRRHHLVSGHPGLWLLSDPLR